MHLEYNPADIMMIDFAGKKQYYVDTSTGERIQCEVFVAILPFSGLIFCQAVLSQKTHDFTTYLNAMLLFYGGVPATILCDNLKTAVIRSDRYEPVFTDLCYQLSEHYGTTFSAARQLSMILQTLSAKFGGKPCKNPCISKGYVPVAILLPLL